MTTTLQSTVTAQVGWTWRDLVGTASIINSNRLAFDKKLADGAGVDQSDAVWHAHDQTLAAEESMTLALDMLEQTLFGDTIIIPLSSVKAILIVNKNTSGQGYLLVGGAATDEWYAPFGASGDTLKVMPDSPLLLANTRGGWDVDLDNSALRLAAVGAEVTFDIAILGVVAGGSDSSSSSSGA